MRYLVHLRRTTVEDVVVNVEAESEDKAEVEAKTIIENGGGDDWDLDDDNLDVVSVEEAG